MAGAMWLAELFLRKRRPVYSCRDAPRAASVTRQWRRACLVRLARLAVLAAAAALWSTACTTVYGFLVRPPSTTAALRAGSIGARPRAGHRLPTVAAAAKAATAPPVAAAPLAPSLLEAKNLYGSHDDIRTLFRIPNLVIRKGQKMAVVGSNGCGKSTLLRALAGKSQLAGGDINVQPGVRVSMVDQAAVIDPTMLVGDAVLAYATSPQAEATRRYNAAVKGGDGDDLTAALEEMEKAAAWEWEAKTKEVMHELGITNELQQREVGMLSGGEERRVALACALVDLDNTDVLILDEPTNHLSAEGCDWLQERLGLEKDLSVLLVTHDRYFLDEVCDEILEIDGLGEAFIHPGGWQTFLLRRAERYALRTISAEAAKTQLKRAEAWMRRGASGRGTKNKAQRDAYEVTKGKASATIKANDGAPALGGSWVMDTGAKGRRTGGASINVALIGLKNASLVLPNGLTVLDRVSFQFPKGSKVGIVGPNGIGKSTFLRALAGEIELTSGDRVEGDDVKIGFLAQEAPRWDDPDQRVINLVQEMADDVMSAESMFDVKDMTRERAAARLLKSVNFDQERWQTQLHRLSGGEARRLQLLRVLSKRPNILLLDEPTNDLDAVTVDALETLLRPWQGTVIMVSHDRSLLDGVCDMHLVFRDRGGKPSIWRGTHAALREHEKMKVEEEALAKELELEEQKAAEASESASAGAAPPPAQAKPKLAKWELRQANRELQKVERDIEKVEESLAEIQESIQEFGSDPGKVMELVEQQTELETRQAELYELWEEAAAKVE